MPRLHLTPTLVANAACPKEKRKIDLYDTATKGLMLEVRETGQTFYLRYQSQRGKRKQFRLADARDVTLAQARQLADRARNRIAMGEDPAETKAETRKVPTFAQFVTQDFLPHIRTYKRSWVCDVSLLNNHLLPVLGELYLDAITRRDVQRLITSRLDMGKAPGTCDRMLILTRRIFNLAIKWKVPGIKSNPAREVDLLNVDNKRERFLSEEEVHRLYNAVLASDNPMLKYIVPMLLLTGARKREVLDARWEDFDIDNRLWRIPITKAGRPRTVPISDGVMSLLGTVPRIAGSNYVFPNPDTGEPFVSVYYAWETARKRAGLKDVRMHDLRHSFASILINSGRSLYEVQHLLGHTQVKTTERYAHLQQETLMTAANVVANFVETAAPQRQVPMIGT